MSNPPATNWKRDNERYRDTNKGKIDKNRTMRSAGRSRTNFEESFSHLEIRSDPVPAGDSVLSLDVRAFSSAIAIIYCGGAAYRNDQSKATEKTAVPPK